ncbi:MAG TPA: ferritin-like domain-containing protein [Firmicutes bacterium]|nr:ferritin-like domain-containing protein [Bacillota bacterium]
MQKAEILKKLNWFYLLEINQVHLYRMQSRQVDDLYIRKALERVAEVEQGHVENIRAKIIELGGTPGKFGEMMGPFSGSVAGLATGTAGTVALLKANIQLEEKAMKDYKDFIVRAGGDSDLFKLLWGNLIDEDLHTAWFSNKVKELEGKQ